MKARTALPSALAALVLGLAACGGDEPADAAGAAGAEPLGPERAGSVASLAQCRDWRGGTVEEKLATIADLRGERGGEQGPGPPIRDERAMRVIDDTCALDYAASFRLYKVYARAVAFGEHAD